MRKNFAADLRTLEWTDLAEVGALCAFIACMILWAGIWSGNFPS